MTNDKPQKSIEMKDLYDVLNNIQVTLSESLKWIKFSGSKEVKSVLESNVQSEDEKMIYSLSDGTNSSYEIAKIMGANDTVRRKISDYWDKWEKAGLGEPKPSQGKGNRFKRSFDLEDFGIKVQIPKQNNQKTEQPETANTQPEVESHD